MTYADALLFIAAVYVVGATLIAIRLAVEVHLTRRDLDFERSQLRWAPIPPIVEPDDPASQSSRSARPGAGGSISDNSDKQGEQR